MASHAAGPDKTGLHRKIEELEKEISVNKKNHTARFQLGAYLFEAGDYKRSADLLSGLVEMGANQVQPYIFCARSLIFMDDYKAAMGAIDKAHKLKLLSVDHLTQLGDFFKGRGAQDYVIKCIELAHKLDPDNDKLLVFLAMQYEAAGNNDRALKMLSDYAQKNPDNALFLTATARLHFDQEDYVIAADFYARALRVEPENADNLYNLGNCFIHMSKPETAIGFFDEALRVNPEHGGAMCSKAGMLCSYGFTQEALEMYAHGIELLGADKSKWRNEFLMHYSNFVFFMHYVPGIDRSLMYNDILKWQKEICDGLIEKPAIDFSNNPDPERKLRVGLISGGFRVHPVGQMIYEALLHLDKSKVELYFYSDVAEGKGDYLTDKLFETGAHVEHIKKEGPSGVLEIIRAHDIDILIEMTGHSEGGKRLPIIAQRVAPVQMKWVGGLFDTTGIPQMDWILGDRIEIPEGDEKWYTEKVYRMPDDYIVYHPPYYAPKVTELPAKTKGYVTFGNLNNLAKTNTYSIALWSEILHQVPDSKILLKGTKLDTEFVQQYTLKRFADFGIDPSRVIMDGGEAHQAFMNVYNQIDIALDPHPYTGGLTTCEALWMGVPVVTLPGETFAGRHAASHLVNAGLEDWVAENAEDYIAIAKKWSEDLDALAALRSELRQKVAASPLVDGPRFADNFEKALRHMWGDWCARKQALSTKN